MYFLFKIIYYFVVIHSRHVFTTCFHDMLSRHTSTTYIHDMYPRQAFITVCNAAADDSLVSETSEATVRARKRLRPEGTPTSKEKRKRLRPEGTPTSKEKRSRKEDTGGNSDEGDGGVGSVSDDGDNPKDIFSDTEYEEEDGEQDEEEDGEQDEEEDEDQDEDQAEELNVMNDEYTYEELIGMMQSRKSWPKIYDLAKEAHRKRIAIKDPKGNPVSTTYIHDIHPRHVCTTYIHDMHHRWMDQQVAHLGRQGPQSGPVQLGRAC